jgi:DNA-binding beta-propeller fold protein YncE
LVDDGNGGLEFQVLNRKTFQGGTGSTPALSADGHRLYVSDNAGNVIALDSELNELWRVDVGEPLVGSISVSPDNNELYAVTASDVIQLIDKGDSGSRAWTAELTGFDGYANVDVQSNALTATATANGVVIMIGGGKKLLGRTLMLHMGMGLLDRATGKLRYFAEGREDSLAMSVVAADGSIYVAHSPLRRAVGKAIYPELTQDVTGGIARFKPIRLDLLARDAICAAEARGANASTLIPATDLTAINTDIRQIKVLIKQARGAITKAVSDGDMTPEKASTLANLLAQSAANLTVTNLERAVPEMAAACSMFG